MIDQTTQQNDGLQGLSLPGISQGGNEDEAVAAVTTKAIQDAFQMGWSIQELKSRVLLGALGLTSTLSISSPQQEPAPASNTSASQATQPVSVIDRLLQSLMPPAPESQAHKTADEQIRKLARIDEWRATYIRIAVIHDQCFPASTTLNTPYDPCSPDKSPKESFAYLYPSSDPDYANVGINGSETLLGEGDLDQESHLENFTLYEVSRRTLNCLTLLLTKPAESLIPNVILSYQTMIVDALFRHLSSSGTNQQGAFQSVAAMTSSTAQESLEEEAITILQEYITEALASPAPETLSLAIKIFSFLLVRFLDSWDGYVSENFYVGGQLKNDSLEVIAYEAGRSLASLVWGVSLITMLAENASVGEQDLLNQLCTIWLRAFDAAPINMLERQISILGPYLDDAYYVLKKVQRPQDGAKPAPDVPSRAIHAITYSLVYWQRGIQWMCQPSSNGGASDMRMTVELSPKLRQTLIDQAGIWHSLILGGQTLRSFASDGVTRRIMTTLMQAFEEKVKENVEETSESAFKRFRVPIIVGGSVFLVLIAGAIILLALTNQLQGLVAIISLLVGSGITAVSAFLSRAGAFVSGEERTVGTMASKSEAGGQLSGLLSLAGGEIGAVFQSAYKQIKLEFDDLNHYTAITYPLIDLFIQNSEDLGKDIKDSYLFLTTVVWTSQDQEEELEQIARAAFGPLGIWVGSLKDQARNTVKNTLAPPNA